MPEEDATESGLLGGRVRLIQQAGGYRVAIDPVLLAAAVPAVAGEHVLDVGAGVAAAALCLAARVPGVRVSGLESQRALVRLANDNADLNGMKGRVTVMEGDLLRPPPRLAPGGFDHVIANPPFLEPGRSSISPDSSKAMANVEGEADLGAWIGFCLAMARDKGSVTVIHRADRLDALLAALYRKSGEIVVYPLWPMADGRPAKRVIVRARKGVASPMRLAAGLVLHRADGTYTTEAEAALRHAAPLEL
jgi:tRNA1(Val) A37 N6-methylase TrmN6